MIPRETLACALQSARASRDALESRLVREGTGPNADSLQTLTDAANRIVGNLTQLLKAADRTTT